MLMEGYQRMLSEHEWSLHSKTHEEMFQLGMRLMNLSAADAIAVILCWHEELKRGRTENLILRVDNEGLIAHVTELEERLSEY